jgi:hypothetical protein
MIFSPGVEAFLVIEARFWRVPAVPLRKRAAILARFGTEADKTITDPVSG